MAVVNNRSNGGAKKLRPTGALHASFRRLRITLRGVVIEDIADTVAFIKCLMFDQVLKTRLKTQAEGFGLSRDIKYLDTIKTLPGTTSYQPVAFKPFSGVIIQFKHLQLRCCL